MTRMGKKEERKNTYPRKRRINLSKKTGPKKEKVAFKEQTNTVNGDYAFIPTIKSR